VGSIQGGCMFRLIIDVLDPVLAFFSLQHAAQGLSGILMTVENSVYEAWVFNYFFDVVGLYFEILMM